MILAIVPCRKKACEVGLIPIYAEDVKEERNSDKRATCNVCGQVYYIQGTINIEVMDNVYRRLADIDIHF